MRKKIGSKPFSAQERSQDLFVGLFDTEGSLSQIDDKNRAVESVHGLIRAAEKAFDRSDVSG